VFLIMLVLGLVMGLGLVLFALTIRTVFVV